MRRLDARESDGLWVLLSRHLKGLNPGGASGHWKEGTGMDVKVTSERLAASMLRMPKYQPYQMLSWHVADVLAGFGLKPTEVPPSDVHHWLFDQGAAYAEAVARHPFEDILGLTYQALASRGQKSHLGQFFTPLSVARLMANISGAGCLGLEPRQGELLRMCEPASGSGALVLAALAEMVEHHGPAWPARWSITTIDLDTLCARMCAAQVLSNLMIGRVDLGELVVYSGDALAPPACLRVVVHTTMQHLKPDLVLPAMHPHRLGMLRGVAARGQERAVQAAGIPSYEGGARPMQADAQAAPAKESGAPAFRPTATLKDGAAAPKSDLAQAETVNLFED